MNEIILEILQLLISLVIIAIGPMIVTWISKNINHKQREELQFWTKFAVQAAEMIYKEKGTGELKKDYVVKFVAEKLDQLKWLEISAEQLDALIEGIVYEVKQLEKTQVEIE